MSTINKCVITSMINFQRDQIANFFWSRTHRSNPRIESPYIHCLAKCSKYLPATSMRLTIFLALLVCTGARHADVDPLRTIVWGPGLKPAEVTMRARYFFLQLVDSHGRKLVLSGNYT